MSAFMPFIVIGIVSGSIYSIAGMGLVLTYKTSGIFNFAHGAVAASMAYIFYELRERQGVPWPIALGVCVLVVSPAVAFAFERLARRIADAPVATKIVATLGILVAVQQLAIIRYGAQTRPFKPFLPTHRLRFFGVNVEVGQLIIVGIALGAAVALSVFFRTGRLGRSMRAVVDNAELLALTGVSPARVRHMAWWIGSAFAGLSGILFAPTIGLDVTILTLLVVQAFGAAALGLFTRLPMTYVGGLVIGIASALSTKYIGNVRWLAGLPPSLPFVALFATLLFAPRRHLVQISVDRQRRAVGAGPASRVLKMGMGATAALLALVVPYIVGVHLITYSAAGAFVIVFLSLALIERMSGQVSLAQLGFAAVGASTFSHLAHGAGVPWLLAVVASATIAVPIGALVAIPAIRLSGLYLALATFGFGLLLERLAFPLSFMFGDASSLTTPRPSFASSDKAYYYVVVLFVLAAVALVYAMQRSRFGRLLRAMADSPVALSTNGTDVTFLKVLVFCISAFLAGLGGALLGPVTGSVSAPAFGTFPSLLLVVVLALQGPVGVYRAAIGGAIALIIVPSYDTGSSLTEWFPVFFGVAALVVSLIDARPLNAPAPTWGLQTAVRRIGRGPVRARLDAISSASTAVVPG